MTSHDKALGRITQAERRVRMTADEWNAVDLAAIFRDVAALECSAEDLRDAAEILKNTPKPDGTPIRSRILELKKSVVRLERLVGASAAFLRSAPGTAREDSGFYQAGGSICPPSPEARGMQV